MSNKAVLAALALAACGPTIRYAPFRGAPVARTVSAAAVEVFYAPPRCPFIELGLVEAVARYTDLEQTMLAMRETAGRRGADGIVIVDYRHRHAPRNGGAIRSAIAVALSDGCRAQSG